MIKYKTILRDHAPIFDKAVEKFTKAHPDYAIQYKPVSLLNGAIGYTAFISYHTEEEEEDGEEKDL